MSEKNESKYSEKYETFRAMIVSRAEAKLKGLSEVEAFIVDDLDAVVDRPVVGKFAIGVKGANPNGDPDLDNDPRTDLVSGRGIITPMCLKRHLRDFWAKVIGGELFMARGAVVSAQVEKVAKTLGIDIEGIAEDEDSSAEGEEDAKKGKKGKKDSKKPIPREQKQALIEALAQRYFDFLFFGAVLGTPYNEGVKGPIQIHFAWSLDPIRIINMGITRGLVANEDEAKTKDRTMGRFGIVAVGLYEGHFSVNPIVSERMGLTWRHLALWLDAFQRMLDFSDSATRDIHCRYLVAAIHGKKHGYCNNRLVYDAIKFTRTGTGDVASLDEYDLKVAPSPMVAEGVKFIERRYDGR